MKTGKLGFVAIVAVAAAIVCGAGSMQAQSGYDLLQKALAAERAGGDLPQAIAMYERIVKDFAADRVVVAKALVRLGYCYQRLGSAQAQAVFDRVVRQFPDQVDAALEARTRLSELTSARPGVNGPTVHLVSRGEDADPAAFVTTDGRFLSRPDWNTGDMVVRNMATGQLTRLMAKRGTFETSDDEVESALVSPNGLLVAFVWYAVSGEDHDELRVMANEVGARQRVLVGGSEYQHIEPIGWAPSGDKVLVSMWKKPDFSATIAWIELGESGLGRMTVLKSLDGRLRGGSRQALSPDGRYVAYSALATNPGTGVRPFQRVPAGRSTNQQLHVLATDGSGSEIILAKGESINESPVWTPDGTRILFVSNRSGQFGIWSTGFQNGKAVGALSPVRASVTGRISPIGMTRSGTLYYVSHSTTDAADRGFDVFIGGINPATGRIAGPIERLSDNGVDLNHAPAWSPDGKRIAFRRAQEGSSDEVVIHDIETGLEKVYPIFTNGFRDSPPIWFHRGNALLVRTGGAPGPNLRRLDLDTGQLEVFTHSIPPEGWLSAVLSPDDSTVYMTVRKPVQPDTGLATILAWNLQTGDRRYVWTLDGQWTGPFSVLALSPDGRSLATIVQRAGWPSRRLVLMETDGSGYREIASSVNGNVLTWTPDGKSLLTLIGSLTESRLMRVPVDKGRPEPVGLTINWPGQSVVDVSPEGSRVVYATGTNQSELWAVDNLPSALTELR